MSDVQSATIRDNVRVRRGDIVRWLHGDPVRAMAGQGEITDIKRGSSWTGTQLSVRTTSGTMLVFANEATLVTHTADRDASSAGEGSGA